MRILVIPGWLMNKNSLRMPKYKLTGLGHEVDIFECPGIDSNVKHVQVTDIINLLRKKIRCGHYDVIIAHGYSINWLLQMKSLLRGKKVILLSPCYKNVKEMWHVIKYVSGILLNTRALHLPPNIIYKVYDIIHASGELTCSNMVDGYFTCNARTAQRLLIQTLKLNHDPNRIVEADCLVIHGRRDPLVRCRYSELRQLFSKYHFIKSECGHDTFNYIGSDVIDFMTDGSVVYEK